MRGMNTIEYLGGLPLVIRWAQRYYELKRADIELLIYLYDKKFFTTQQFKDGSYYYSWDKNRFLRLNREEWFKKIYEGNRRMGEHDKYALSKKAELMIRRIDRILKREELIPESPARNPVMRRETYSDKILATAIIKYNNQTRKNGN